MGNNPNTNPVLYESLIESHCIVLRDPSFCRYEYSNRKFNPPYANEKVGAVKAVTSQEAMIPLAKQDASLEAINPFLKNFGFSIHQTFILFIPF
jgi:hypothetical protein